MDLLLGCGSSRDRKMNAGRDKWNDLVTVDIIDSHKPDVVWDLENIPLSFADNSADEIHLYDVLEHVGKQGDYKFFFAQFEDFWRILKPNGYLFAIVPNSKSVWLWGDPGHTRTINYGSLVFLSQKEYRDQVGLSPMTDYRFCYKGDFVITGMREDEFTFQFALKAVK